MTPMFTQNVRPARLVKLHWAPETSVTYSVAVALKYLSITTKKGLLKIANLLKLHLSTQDAIKRALI